MIVEMERQLDELRRTVEELSGEMHRARQRVQRARAAAEQARVDAEEEARRRAARERDANAIVPRSAYSPRPWEGV
jgi:hypothetical protein